MIAKAKQTDYTGMRFGRWTVVAGPFHKGKGIMWDCVCDCGNTGRIYAGHLAGGKSTSCGCYGIEMTKAANTTHGGTAGGKDVEYDTWAGMHARCKNHPRYVGKGIRVCSGWGSYPNFLAKMGRRPSAAMSIDRINNKLHYSCGECQECLDNGWEFNCRWETDEVQANNKDSNVLLTMDGETMTAAQWGRKLGINPEIFYGRKRQGMSDVDVLTKPIRRKTKCS